MENSQIQLIDAVLIPKIYTTIYMNYSILVSEKYFSFQKCCLMEKQLSHLVALAFLFQTAAALIGKSIFHFKILKQHNERLD
ncbi:hypothetical protein T4D_6973 [Trichinella pseudospiralis]|uniref:Transmembrane protein n=1 Tax=Trichinella pseudospiralis TaxID=6337 RepID=A0A0V1G0U4_TRIPS|nr:hypothetical protein T4D_6973 [Trichinella pseudospiralis]